MSAAGPVATKGVSLDTLQKPFAPGCLTNNRTTVKLPPPFFAHLLCHRIGQKSPFSSATTSTTAVFRFRTFTPPAMPNCLTSKFQTCSQALVQSQSTPHPRVSHSNSTEYRGKNTTANERQTWIQQRQVLATIIQWVGFEPSSATSGMRCAATSGTHFAATAHRMEDLRPWHGY